MEKCVIYVRVSTSEQDYTSQIQDLEDYARYKKLKVADVFGEEVSGFDIHKERLEYDRMKTFVLDNNIKEIIIWELSRFSRNTRRSLSEIEFFRKEGVNIYFKKENINTLANDANSNLLTTIMSAFAELERETIVERSKRGRDQSAIEGKRIGMPNLHYGIDVDDKGYLIPHRGESKVVKRIYKWFLMGYSYERIADELNQRDIPTKKGVYNWLPTTIRSILRNPIYIGKRRYRDLDIVLNKLKIIDDEIFEKAQEHVELKINNYHSLKRHNANNFDTHHYKGKIRCGHCGRNFGAMSEPLAEEGKFLYSYRCTGVSGTAARRRNAKCDAGQIKASVIDMALHLMLEGSDYYIEDRREAGRKNFDTKEENAKLTNAKNELLKIKTRKKVAQDFYTKDLDQAAYNKRMLLINEDEKKYMEIKSAQEQKLNKYHGKGGEDSYLNIFKKYPIPKGKPRLGVQQGIIQRLVEKVVIYKIENWTFDWTKMPKRWFVMSLNPTENRASILEWNKGFNLNPKKNSEKVFYIELYLFSLEEPIKAVRTSVTSNFYVGDDLSYNNSTRTISWFNNSKQKYYQIFDKS